MAEVSKIVRERLRAGSAAMLPHPDAETLTAFAERTLPGRERETVLEHLARCGECREVVALALPASESAHAAASYARGSWLSWPALRWGFAAAGIVLVTAVGVVQYQRHNRESAAMYKVPTVSQAKNENAVAPAPSTASADQAAADKELDQPESPTPAASNIEKAKKSRPRDELARSAVPGLVPQSNLTNPVASAHGGVGGALAHGPKMGLQMNRPSQWQQNANTFDAAAPAPPSQGATAANSDRLAAQRAEAAAQTANNLTLQSETLAQQVPDGGLAEQKVDRAKPLETVIVGNTKMYAGTPRSARLARATSVSGTPQWTINSSGSLQRSLDQGASWQDVNVNASPSPAPAGISLVAKEQTDALNAAAKDEKQAAQIVFRAVAANGPDVWAGGVNGMLYHSIDAGNHWTHVVPSTPGASLTGDIVSVSFLDAQHGRIATSTSEAWVTSDGGQSWEKQ